jgi:hypothetical protein
MKNVIAAIGHSHKVREVVSGNQRDIQLQTISPFL